MKQARACPFCRLHPMLLQEVLSRMDLASMWDASAACSSLRAAFFQLLPHMPAIHIEDIVPDRRLLEVFLPCTNSGLRSLKLDCSKLGDGAISVIAKPRLQELSLQSCQNFTASYLIRQLGLKCHELKNLSLNLERSEDSVVDLQMLLRNCSLLESIALTCPSKWLAAFKTVDQLQFLSSLELCCMSTEDAVEMVGTPLRFPGLRRLSLVLRNISDQLMRTISDNLAGLVELELWDEPFTEPMVSMDLTNTGMQSLGSLFNLTRLSVVRSWAASPISFRRVNDVGFLTMMHSLVNLESIRLGGFSRVTDAGWSTILSTCTRLHTLELMKTDKLTDLAFHNLSSTDLGLKAVNLASNHHRISRDTVINLVLCKGLQVLNLKSCNGIGDDSLKEIAKLQELKVLLLDGSEVMDDGLRALGSSRMPLVTISLRGCSRVTDDGVVALLSGGLGRTLECIDLSGIPRITIRSVMAIVEHAVKVVDLWLRSCPLQDDSVAALASMHMTGRAQGATLRLLDLSNCNLLSENVLRWFERPFFPRLGKLGLPRLDALKVRRLNRERPYMRIQQRASELGRRRGEGNWMGRTLGRYGKQEISVYTEEYYTDEEEYYTDEVGHV